MTKNDFNIFYNAYDYTLQHDVANISIYKTKRCFIT